MQPETMPGENGRCAKKWHECGYARHSSRKEGVASQAMKRNAVILLAALKRQKNVKR